MLTYPLRKNDSDENKWHRAFFVKNNCKNIVFSHLRMNKQVSSLLTCPHFECFLLFQKLTGPQIAEILSLLLLSKSVMIVSKDDTYGGDLLSTILFLLSPM